jgi:putative component of membrane protein insertase Oxa1/YidC/SpoIIIJ protein YidD
MASKGPVALRAGVWIYRRVRGSYLRRHPGARRWCAMTPTCSTYAHELLEHDHGLRSYWLVLRRIYIDCPRAHRRAMSAQPAQH